MEFVCYPKCSTCQKAKRFLDAHGVAYTLRDIQSNRPSEKELYAWWKASGLPLRKFFNTSGLAYRALSLKEKLPEMSEEKQLKLLASDGMLVKRPVLVKEGLVLVGFRQKSGRKRCFPEEIAYAVLFCSYGGNYDCSVPESPSPLFPGMDQYYTPFLSPARDHVFSKRDLQEILPEHQEGVPVVPQLLTKYPEDFIWAAGELAAMGYQEVNLNLGCPSGTVVAKGRGAGMLEDLEFLERFLDQIFLHVRHFTFRLKPGWGFPARILFPSFWSCTTGTRFGS